ncbi:hypothetical protein AB0B94_27770 [Micromonospora sp. NPDC048986]|uniref:hypothetical protein n=1 Tax=Micromonospora sp. NPDC048986 TaxID=3155644 RepID=UPI0033DAF3D8
MLLIDKQFASRHQSPTRVEFCREAERDFPLVVVEVLAYVHHRHAGLGDDISRDHACGPSEQIGNIHARIFQRRSSIRPGLRRDRHGRRFQGSTHDEVGHHGHAFVFEVVTGQNRSDGDGEPESQIDHRRLDDVDWDCGDGVVRVVVTMRAPPWSSGRVGSDRC